MKRIGSILAALLLVGFAGFSLATTTNSSPKPTLVDDPAANSAAANLGDTDASSDNGADTSAGDSNAAGDTTFGNEGSADGSDQNMNDDSSDDSDDNSDDNSDDDNSDNGADD